MINFLKYSFLTQGPSTAIAVAPAQRQQEKHYCFSTVDTLNRYLSTGVVVNPFQLYSISIPPEIVRISKDFSRFLGGIEMKHWIKMG